MKTFTPPVTLVELQNLYSAKQAVADIATEINELQANVPPKKYLVVTMRTPDGRTMLVELIKPVGFQTFLAKGYIDNLPCTIMAHISTLNVFCAYEEARGKSRVGFIIQVTEPLSESEQK